ncbi:hypothetical protein DFH27DRAFT_562727 [Peziza echinospora]|nr:hypothetical protein DFH27DRAFT_562727 [Peziza echinospora]
MAFSLSRRFFLRSALLALVFLPLFALASPHAVSNLITPDGTVLDPTEGAQEFDKRAEEGNEQTCGFAGDQDTYGLGIRIGLYLQWVTSSTAYNLVPSEAVTMRGVNNCFQAAMFAGLLFVTITKGAELHAVEAYLMLLFCMGGVCSGTINESEVVDDDFHGATMVGQARAKSYAYMDTTTLGGFFRLLLGCAFEGYGLWFVYVGMDGMLHPPCSTYAFFFARVNLFGWFRTLLKVLFTLSAIPTALALFLGTFNMFSVAVHFVLGDWRNLRKSGNVNEPGSPGAGEVHNNNTHRDDGHGKSEAPDDHAAPQEEPDRIAVVENKSRIQSLNNRRQNVGFSGALVLFIVAVELTIKWNKIEGVQDVGSTGQLLPLIIGIGGVGRVAHELVADILRTPKYVYHDGP